MIAALHGGPFPDGARKAVARALTLGRGAAQDSSGALTDFQWLGSAGQHFGWFGPVCALVQGWIDNAGDLAGQLELADSDPARVYAAALVRWGDDADRHVVGNYAAIAELADGSLRLARSPWDAPPLYHHHAAGSTVVSPLLRAIFAAGVPRRLDYDRVIDELAYVWRDGEERGWYHDVLQVPLGCAITYGSSGRRLDRWYSVDELPQVRFADDPDYVEAATALLDEAARKALATCRRPAIALSGGLDSPLAAAALTQAMPEPQRLTAVTFAPHPDWDGIAPPGTIGDETEVARAFAEYNGQIELHVADPQQGGFDFRADEMFRAMQVYAPGLANVGMMHGVWAKAAELGCDMLFTADLGNQTVSDAGRWAYVEYARRGKWGELGRLLDARAGDTRSMARKIAALSILPQLPAAARRMLRSVVHPERHDMTALFTLLSARARRDRRGAWNDVTLGRSRREVIRNAALQANGPAADVHLAFEQLYGLRRRDVMAYRPLVEFCLGLPTEQFASEGVERRLARRMGKGRLPEAHRLAAATGQHNVDWHARLTPRREELLAYTDALADHPWLSETIDLSRMRDLLERWPDTSDFSWDEGMPRAMALPRIVLAARFIAIAEGRNDL